MRTTIPPPPPPPATILVLGATGVGKSSLLSACGGRGFDVGHVLKSKTEEVHSWTGTIGGNLVTLVDTPGLGDTYTPDSEIIERLCLWLQNEYEHQRRISGIILLQRITDNRMTQLSKRSIEMAHQLCGDHAMPNTILCTTFWDKVDLSQGEKREQELREQYWQEMINLGAIVRRHDNTPGSALSIISSLVDKPPFTLQLQQELAEGIKLNETSLGIALLGDLGLKEDEIIQRIREAQSELATERDRGLRRMLELEQQKNIAQYRLLEEDRLRMGQNIYDVRTNQMDPENRSKWAQRGRTALRITLMGLGFAGLILALV